MRVTASRVQGRNDNGPLLPSVEECISAVQLPQSCHLKYRAALPGKARSATQDRVAVDGASLA